MRMFLLVMKLILHEQDLLVIKLILHEMSLREFLLMIEFILLK